jgi:hypothetical protein
MITSHTTRSIEDHLNSFAGRPEMEGYDETKQIKIAEENRDFVWPEFMWYSLIVSILTGFPIPAMITCNDELMDGGNRSTVLMKWRQNKFTVKIADWEGNYQAMCINPLLSARWNRCMIPMTSITNASKAEKSQIFENYNSGIRLTFGQLLKNRSYRPLVKCALSMIKGSAIQFPLRELISRVWRQKWKKTKTLSELAFAYQIIVASIFGPDYFHTKFTLHTDKLMTVEQDQIDLTNLQFICEVIGQADPENNINSKKKEAVFKKFIGAMIYDLRTIHRDEFSSKWKSFCIKAYTTMTPEETKAIVDVKTARATQSSRLRALSDNVSAYLKEPVQNELPNTDTDTDTQSDSDDDSDE